MINLH